MVSLLPVGAIMPRQIILSALEREALLASPVSCDDLIRWYTFSEPDLALIRLRRGDANRRTLEHGILGTGGARLAATRFGLGRKSAAVLIALGWEHINLTGDYVWRQDRTRSPGKFRPLRVLPRA